MKIHIFLVERLLFNYEWKSIIYIKNRLVNWMYKKDKFFFF